jgi:hypothetical protein
LLKKQPSRNFRLEVQRVSLEDGFSTPRGEWSHKLKNSHECIATVSGVEPLSEAKSSTVKKLAWYETVSGFEPLVEDLI